MQRMLKEYARVGLGHYWYRLGMLVGATAISSFFYDLLISLAGFLACAIVDFVDLNFCRAALAADLDDPETKWFHERRLITTGTLLPVAIVAYASAIVVASEDNARIVALLFVLAAAHCAGSNQNQLKSVLYARLSILFIAGTTLALLPIWRGPEVQIPFVGPSFLATVFAFAFIFDSARVYHESHLNTLQQDAELNVARATVEREQREKSAMISTMSHELRTPLNGILGMAQILEYSDLTEEQRHSVGVIQSAGAHLNALISDIADTERLMTGGLDLFPIETEPRTVLDEVIATQTAVAAEKGLVLTAQFSPDIPARLRFDPARAAQCVNNLIGNAIKFTQEGQIRVTASYGAIAAGGKLLIDVEDTGIGMTEDEIASLFNPFKQVDQSETREHGGAGLGLWISRSLAAIMGGDLTVQSTPGKGSRFRLSIAAVPVVEGAKLSDGSLAGLRMLHVDDVEVNRDVVRMLLDPHGIQVTGVDNAFEALERIKDGDFDVVLSDGAMPGMSGAELAARVRELASPIGRVPLIAVSADNSLADDSVRKSRGFNAFVPKPVEEQLLVSTILKHARRTGCRADAEALQTAPAKQRCGAANAPMQPRSEPRVLVAGSAGSSHLAASSSGS